MEKQTAETTAKTKLLGLIGHPVSHSLSPKMHSYFAKCSGRDTVYLAFDLKKEELLQIVDSAAKMGVLGFNITAPYKTDILPALAGIDEEARHIGSVNTIVNREGKWYGYNTDGKGFVHSLEKKVGSVQNKKVLLIGAGGAAKSISYEFAKRGVASVSVSARNMHKVAEIKETLTMYTDCSFFEEMNPKEIYDIIVNTTPLGMHEHAAENPFKEHMSLVTEETVCCDLIYNPKKTVFLSESQKRGARIVNGLPMLVLQGIYAYELFTDTKLPESCFEETLKLFREYETETLEY